MSSGVCDYIKIDAFNQVRLGILDGTPKGWWIEEITIEPTTIDSGANVYYYARCATHYIELAMPLAQIIQGDKDQLRRVVKDQTEMAVENSISTVEETKNGL
jgi:hypothetical protein